MLRENWRVPKNITYERVYNLALELFGDDHDKTNSWWMAPNEHFDNKSPYEMVKEGKARKLIRLLEKCGI